MKSSQTLLNPVDLPVIDSVQPPKLSPGLMTLASPQVAIAVLYNASMSV
jgi:hypothetical protein